jgi:hypothetical protein
MRLASTTEQFHALQSSLKHSSVTSSGHKLAVVQLAVMLQ